MAKKSKTDRVMEMYLKLSSGKVVNKAEEAQIYDVDERTILRDISDLRCIVCDFQAETASGYCEIEYDRRRAGYVMRRVV